MLAQPIDQSTEPINQPGSKRQPFPRRPREGQGDQSLARVNQLWGSEDATPLWLAEALSPEEQKDKDQLQDSGKTSRLKFNIGKPT